MELCTDSGGSGFRTCLSVFSAAERWKSHCGILRCTAWTGAVLASGTVTGSFVLDFFPGDCDRTPLLPFDLHICVVFGQYDLPADDDGYQYWLLSDFSCGYPKTLRQISGRTDESASATSSLT